MSGEGGTAAFRDSLLPLGCSYPIWDGTVSFGMLGALVALGTVEGGTAVWGGVKKGFIGGWGGRGNACTPALLCFKHGAALGSKK